MTILYSFRSADAFLSLWVLFTFLAYENYGMSEDEEALVCFCIDDDDDGGARGKKKIEGDRRTCREERLDRWSISVRLKLDWVGVTGYMFTL